MTSLKARRTRLGSLLAVALGAAAIFVLPGLASARDDSGGSGGGGGGATIKSFDPATGTLAVALPNGETVTGTVTRRTKIRCEDQSSRHGRHGRDDRVRAREAEPGDDNGGHGNEPGDDNGGDGNEPGDDNGGDGNEPGDDNGGHGNEPGDDNGGDGSRSGNSGSSGHDDNGRGANCTSADLVVGAAVDEVELDFGQTGVRFDEIELD